MKKACTDCGTVRDVGKRPSETYRCHPCRRADPEPLRIVTRICQTDSCTGTFDVPKRARRKYCDPCVASMVAKPTSTRWAPCSVCGAMRKRNQSSAKQIICVDCRAKQRAEREAYKAIERSGDELAGPRRAKAARVSAYENGRTTTARGLGRQHEVAVAELKRTHIDGSPCDWCGRPMWLSRIRNWDYESNGGHLSGILSPLPRWLLHLLCSSRSGGRPMPPLLRGMM